MSSVKKSIAISFLSLAVLLVVGYIILDKTLYTTLHTHDDMEIYKTLDEIEKNSEIVVKVVFTGDKKNHMELEENGLPLWYWTESMVTIKEVLKGTSVAKNDKIMIYEPYGIFDNKIGKSEITPEEYNKMENGKEYIFMLRKKADESGYIIIGVHQGKINIGEVTKYNEKLDKLLKEKYKIE